MQDEKEIRKIVEVKKIRYHSISAKHYPLRLLNFKESCMYLYAWAKMDFRQSKLFVNFNLFTCSVVRLLLLSRVN